MTEHDYQCARAAVHSVAAARIVSAVMGVYLLLSGKLAAAFLFFVAIPLLHFALPVVRKPDRRE